jgi:cytochrome c
VAAAAGERPAGKGQGQGQVTERPPGPDDYVNEFPIEINLAALERGRQRYNIFCAVCHDETGNGNGKIVERGYTRPPSYVTDYSRGFDRRGYKVLLRDVPVGYFMEVITQGYGAMPDYSSQVPPEDRWKIAAYIKALQLSQHADLNDPRLRPARDEIMKELDKVEKQP